jgi:hypothetical protein
MPTIAEWNPDHPAVWRELVHGENRAITLRHPAYPAMASWTNGAPSELESIAAAYLAKVSRLFRLPDLFDDDRRFKLDVRLTWLPVDAAETPAPSASFLLGRYGEPAASGALIDRTAVLLAVEAADLQEPNTPKQPLGSRRGIRIVAHVSTYQANNVRITGASCSIDLLEALDPERSGQFGEIITAFVRNFFFTTRGKERLKNDIRLAVGLRNDTEIWLDGLRLRQLSGDCARLDVYANVPRPDDAPHALSYALTVGVLFRPGPEALPTIIAVEKFPLVADAAPVEARLFPLDPASLAGGGRDARPNRSPTRLERYRRTMTLPGVTLDHTGCVHLLDDLAQVKVMQSRLVDEAADECQEETVDPTSVSHARMNPFGALSGYQHARSLFDTMRAYGLSPVQYFKFAAWPLLVRYRAPIQPGPGKDGKTINAQVTYDPAGCDAVGAPWNTDTLKPLQVRFALADLQRSSSHREPLGLAADPRWSWHEYSHVLLAASTGALELHFVHSVGDALAAIMCDPLSQLAHDEQRRWRGYTFPWVYLHRRHDRSVFDGWSWSGRYHRPARFASNGSNSRRKGYQSEQILSTSLFQLYRALGGDTVCDNGCPDLHARQAAADYTVYLIMRAIGLLGPAIWTSVETPDQLVSALIDADIGTWPVPQGPLQHRVGGWAHKVVRWAFEAQGLYATTDPLAVIDAPGKPPDVDVFIDTKRPNSEGDYPRGGYAPASLDWHTGSWQACPAAVQVVNNDRVLVEVRNRGQSLANGVTVQVWCIAWPPNTAPPAWNPERWTDLGSSAAQAVPAWPTNPPVQFGPFVGLPTPPTKRLLILAAATCPADPANNDPVTGLPCATVPTPIVDLVAGDNNLGLLVHNFP